MAQRKIVWTKTADIQFVGVFTVLVRKGISRIPIPKINSTRNRKNKTNCKTPTCTNQLILKM